VVLMTQSIIIKLFEVGIVAGSVLLIVWGAYSVYHF
jgi:hypothetical protein